MPSGGDGRAISLDGYAVGPDQGPEHPLGVGGDQLHTWAFATRTFRQMFGEDGTDEADESIDDRFAAQGDVGIGATVMGRNMFGPIRGSWGDEQWRGWWGDDPPYHHPVFVLTHHPRAPTSCTGDRTDPARQRRAALRQPRGAPDRLRVRGARQLAGGGPRAARAHGSERVWVGARRVRWCSRQRPRARRTRSCHTGNGVRLGVSRAKSRRRGRGPWRAGPGGPPSAP